MNKELFVGELEAGCEAVQEGLDILSELLDMDCPIEEDDKDFMVMQLEIMESALADISSSFCL